jgi:hypothetical protein
MNVVMLSAWETFQQTPLLVELGHSPIHQKLFSTLIMCSIIVLLGPSRNSPTILSLIIIILNIVLPRSFHYLSFYSYSIFFLISSAIYYFFYLARSSSFLLASSLFTKLLKQLNTFICLGPIYFLSIFT